jgi:hypothetical protein
VEQLSFIGEYLDVVIERYQVLEAFQLVLSVAYPKSLEHFPGYTVWSLGESF